MASARQWLIGFVLLIALVACPGATAGDRVEATPVVVHVERGGFRWSDAGIGALAGIGISLSACGCLALVRLRSAESTSSKRGVGP